MDFVVDSFFAFWANVAQIRQFWRYQDDYKQKMIKNDIYLQREIQK